MKNPRTPVFRTSLDHFWNERENFKLANHERAETIMDALIKGGLTPAAAKTEVEFLWAGGRAQGYMDAQYDSNDHD